MKRTIIVPLLALSGCLTECGAVGKGVIGYGAIAPLSSGSSPVVPPGTPDVWYAAHKETAYSDNDSVGTVTDFGARGYDATQGTGTAQPTFKNPCESGVAEDQPCFDFDGGDNLSTGAQTAEGQDFIVAAVVRFDATSSMIAIDSISSGNWLWGNSGTLQVNAGATLSSGQTYLAGDYDWACSVFDGVSSSVTVSGSTPATGNAGANSWSGVFLGSRNTSSFYLNGAILEYLYYDDPGGQGVTCDDIGTYFDSVYGATWPKT